MTNANGSVKGPSIFLAQGWGKPGWTTLEECAASAASLGYKGMQAFLWSGMLDLELAAASQDYCQELQGRATAAGCPIVEVANHCDTQLVRCLPGHIALHQWPTPKHLHHNHVALANWAQTRAKLSVAAARNFGFDSVAAFSGTSLFPFFYEWPQRPKGFVEAAMHALADAWLPVFNYADDLGVDVAFELHPGEDLMDGDSFDRFLPYVNNHKRCCILLDLSHMVLSGMKMEQMLAFIREHADRIKMMHVKDGEFVPRSGGGVYGGYNKWSDRQSRFRSLGDGQIDYADVLALLNKIGLGLWATVEWEDCAGKGWNQGVREGAAYVQAWLDGTPEPQKTNPDPGATETFDDFAGGGEPDKALLAELLGIPWDAVNTNAPLA